MSKKVMEDASPTVGTEKKEMETDSPEPSSSRGKRKYTRRLKQKSPSKQKGEEDVCFICFDGGHLVFCDHAGCPKAYHPKCVDKDEAFFQSTTDWKCSWHICSKCEKAAQFMCYTCLHSLCKGCMKEDGFLCVRGNKGFCESCMKNVMLLENSAHTSKEKEKTHFDDKNSWEYLFKCYWLDLKGKLSLTLRELTGARNPCKKTGVFSRNEKSSNKLNDGNDDLGSSSDSSLGHNDAGKSTGKMKKRLRSFTNEKGAPFRAAGGEGSSKWSDIEWASKELLEFVLHMRGGNRSILSEEGVLLLLLEYIRRNNLRDLHKRSQIICDPMLCTLFGKARVGHVEMLKLLDSHILVKENTDAVRIEASGNSRTKAKMTSSKRKKAHKIIEERKLQTNFHDYASIDVHNINLIYLPRGLVETLIDDMETFEDKVVGSFVRIKISGMGQKQYMHHLVRVVGTSKTKDTYRTGKKTTDILLEILNLGKTEVISIDAISDQEFSEEECSDLHQSIKRGLFSRLTVGEVLEKAMDLQAVRVNDWLEKELLQLGRIRDRANEKGRRKELKESLEKIQLLSSDEERSRRLEEIPEVHADLKMDPSYESDKDHRDLDNYKRPRDAGSMRKGKEIASADGGSGWEPCINMSAKGAWEASGSDAVVAVSSNISETEKIWHYQDPSGKIQGLFSMTQFLKWSKGGYFPEDLRIWKASEQQEDSILLTDALGAKLEKEPPPWDPFLSSTQPGSGQNNEENGWGGAVSSTGAEKQNSGGWNSWKNASDSADGVTDGWGNQSSAWATETTEPVNSKGDWGGSSSQGWGLVNASKEDDIATADQQPPVSGMDVLKQERNSKFDTATLTGDGEGSDLPPLNEAEPGASTKVDKNTGWETAEPGALRQENSWGAAEEGKPTEGNTNLGWETAKSGALGKEIVNAGWRSSEPGTSTRGVTNTGWGGSQLEILTHENSSTGWGMSEQGMLTPENTNLSWGKPELETSVQGNTQTSGGTVEHEKLAEGNAGVGWGLAVQEKLAEGNPRVGWGTAEQEKSPRQNTNTGWGTAEGETSMTNPGLETDKREISTQEKMNLDWGSVEVEDSEKGSRNTGWETDEHEKSSVGDTNTGLGKATEGSTNTGWGTATKENTSIACGTAGKENTNTGWGTTTTEGNTNAGNTSTGWGAAGKEIANTSWGMGKEGNTNAGWGSGTKENTNADWGTVREVSTNTGWGTAGKENTSTDWGTTRGNTNSVYGRGTEGNTKNNDWGTAGKENTSTDWGTTRGNTNSVRGRGTEGNAKNNDWGAAGKENTNVGWQVGKDGNTRADWGATTEENTDKGWGATGGESVNKGWGVAKNENSKSDWGSATNAGWGSGQGNRNKGWDSSAGGSDMRGSQQKHTRERFTNQEGDRGFQRGGERPSWNRSGQEGGSSQMGSRGGGQRICKFHESGFCKKGSSCNFLHA